MEEKFHKTAIFKLERFFIPKFSCEEPKVAFAEVDLNLTPSGIYNPTNGEYQLTFDLKVIGKSGDDKKEYKEIISANCLAYFIIDKSPSFTEIPDFFFSNCIAIVFPYMRAFISTLTLQAGQKMLILPILDLTSMSASLKNETTILNP